MRARIVLFLSLSLASCDRKHEASIGPTPESAAASNVRDAGTEDASVDAATTNASTCKHLRPFESRMNPPKLVVPAPYDTFTPCDLLRAIHPDYDEKTGQSAAAGGALAIDHASLWTVSGRTLLALLYYSGSEAEMDMVYGQSRVAVHVTVLEKQKGVLVQLSKPKDPWRPEEKPDEILALFNGRAEFEETAYSIVPGEPMLAIKTPWSMGMSGYWSMLTLYRLSGSSVDQVFEHELETVGTGPGLPENDVVRSEMTFEPNDGGPSDIRIVTTEAMCKTDYDKPGEPVTCKKAIVVGKEKWQFKGGEYKRVEGKGPPLPRVLRAR